MGRIISGVRRTRTGIYIYTLYGRHGYAVTRYERLQTAAASWSARLSHSPSSLSYFTAIRLLLAILILHPWSHFLVENPNHVVCSAFWICTSFLIYIFVCICNRDPPKISYSKYTLIRDFQLHVLLFMLYVSIY